MQSHGLQHNRLSCPSPNPRVCSNSCPLSQRCHQPSHPLSSLLLLPSIFPNIRVFSNESALHIRWPKNWSFSFSTRPFNEYLALISFKIDSFDLLAVQGTLKSLLQHHNSKASFLVFLKTSNPLVLPFQHPKLTCWQPNMVENSRMS